MLLLLSSTYVYAVDTEVQDLSDITSPVATDDMYIVDDPDGTPASKKIDISALLGVGTDLEAGGALSANTVDSSELVNGGVDLSHMSVNSVDSDQYVDASIDTAHYAAASVDATAMGANSVDSSELIDGSVDLSHMSSQSVDSDNIVDATIVEADLNADEAPADDDILTYDTTGANFSWQTLSELGIQGILTNKAGLHSAISDVSDFAEADGDVFTGTHDFGGATSIEIVNGATPTTNATGEIALDTTITDHQPLIQYYDGAENMTVIAIDTAELPATDNEIVKYNAATDKFVLEADADSGGAPEGTAVLSTGEGGGTKYLREDGDDTCSWQTVVAGHDGTITWTGTSILETGAAFKFGDGTDATVTHTYGNTGTDVSIAYSTAAMGVTGALTATNLSGTNTGDNTVATSGDSATSFFSSGTIEDARLPSSMADKTITGSLVIPQGAAPTVDAAGEIAVDTTDDQLVYYGSVKRVISHTKPIGIIIADLAAADDNYPFGMFNDPVTITGIGVHCDGTCTTPAVIALSDRSGNAMTHASPTVSTGTGNTTYTAVTANNSLVAGEGLEFSVTNAVSPETDIYTIMYTYTWDAQ